MISAVIFVGALTIFAGALPRGPHPGDEARLWYDNGQTARANPARI